MLTLHALTEAIKNNGHITARVCLKAHQSIDLAGNGSRVVASTSTQAEPLLDP